MSSGKADKGGALSRSARSLVDAAREADTPTAADRERVKKALAVAIAAGAVTAGAAGASAGVASAKAALASGAAASSGGLGAGAAASGVAAGGTVAGGVAVGGVAAGGIAAGGVAAGGVAAGGTVAGTVLGASLLTKVAFVVVAVGVTSGAILATQTPSAAPSEDASVSAEVVAQPVVAPQPPLSVEATTRSTRMMDGVEQAPTEVAPEGAPAALEPPIPAVAPSAEVRHPVVRAARREEPVVEAEPPTSAMEPELAVLAPGVLGPPAEMLERVADHEQRFPQGTLASVRDSMRRRAIRALCEEGPAAVAAYLDAHPSSPHASAIRSACP